MDKKDIKVGETYLFPVIVAYIDNTGWMYVKDSSKQYEYRLAPSEVKTFCPLPPENGIKNTEAAPKYDPCRKFKAGDRVSPCFWYNRPPTAYYIDNISGHITPEDGLYEVYKDEMPDSTVLVRYKGKVISMQACHLELMTPIEERDPYSVGKSELKTDDCECDTWAVFDMAGYTVAQFVEEAYNPGEAKARAEQERDRRNAEYRKEQSNG